jgi:hypothetical protein
MDKDVFNEGYGAQVLGKSLTEDNPYSHTDPNHWTWRKGFLQAFVDSQ